MSVGQASIPCSGSPPTPLHQRSWAEVVAHSSDSMADPGASTPSMHDATLEQF
jgi:hypothetical protein